jgi:hypothetical protein
MAVPTPSNPAVRNTTGGAFVAQKQGGSVLGNTSVGDVITKALALKDNATEFINALPKALNNGLASAQKALSGGTFAYSVAGQYVIRTISTTLSGVSSDTMLIPSRAIDSTPPIAKFRHDFGADVASLMRKNRFTRTGFFNNGNKVSSRVLWLNAAGTAVATPSTLSGGFMYDIADGNASNMAADSAAEPSRAVPGELVMKVDFVTLTVASGGDFFDYKPITGM